MTVKTFQVREAGLDLGDPNSYYFAIFRREKRQTAHKLFIGGLILENRLASNQPQMVVAWLVTPDKKHRELGVGSLLANSAI